MMQCLIRKLAALSQYEEVLAKLSSTATDRLTVLKTKPQSIQRDIMTVCSDPYTLAQQLTHIELVRPYLLCPLWPQNCLFWQRDCLLLKVRITQKGSNPQN